MKKQNEDAADGLASLMLENKYGQSNLYPKFFRKTVDLLAALSDEEVLLKNKALGKELIVLAEQTKKENKARVDRAPAHVRLVCWDKNWALFNTLIKRAVEVEGSLHGRKVQIQLVCEELYKGFSMQGEITQ